MNSCADTAVKWHAGMASKKWTRLNLVLIAFGDVDCALDEVYGFVEAMVPVRKLSQRASQLIEQELDCLEKAYPGCDKAVS